MENNKLNLSDFTKELSENSGGGGNGYLVTINHHRVVDDKPQNQSADYVLGFDAFHEKDNTFYANVAEGTDQHFTISTSNIDEITIENNPEGMFSEEECFKVFHVHMKTGDVISVGIYEK